MHEHWIVRVLTQLVERLDSAEQVSERRCLQRLARSGGAPLPVLSAEVDERRTHEGRDIGQSGDVQSSQVLQEWLASPSSFTTARHDGRFFPSRPRSM